jgi:hypothetical protein
MKTIAQQQQEMEQALFGAMFAAIMEASKIDPDTVVVDGDVVFYSLARMAACIITMSAPEVQAKMLDTLCQDIKLLVDDLRENPELHPFRDQFTDFDDERGTLQ